MFERDLAVIGERISQALAGLGAPAPGEVKWQPIPFAGEWGQGTNICFQAAAAEARSGKKVNVPARAQELARLVAEQVALPPGFARLAADKAYVNAYFDTASFAGRVAGKKEPISTWYELPKPQRDHFSFLTGAAAQMMVTGKATYPVERTLLTTGMLESVQMALAATLAGLILSVPLGIAAARNLAPRPVYMAARGFIVAGRTLHEVIIAIFFVKLFGFGPVAGLLTLAFVHWSAFPRLGSYRALDPDQRWRRIARMRRSALGPFRDLVRFYEGLAIFGFYEELARADSPPQPHADSPPPCGEGLGVGGTPTSEVLQSPPPCPSPRFWVRASGATGEGTPTRGEAILACTARSGRWLWCGWS